MQLRAEKLVVKRGQHVVISHVSFELSLGEALLLTGPNGSGKTTLLRTIAGFIKPSFGHLDLDAEEADRPLAERCHYLGHQNAIKPSLTVVENANFWWQFLAEHPVDLAPGQVGAALDTFGLLELADVPAGYLSAGQQRRLSLSRLLLVRRPIWLLDEPMVSLDAASQGVLESVINRHLRGGGLALIATHHPIDISPQWQLALSPAAEAA